MKKMDAALSVISTFVQADPPRAAAALENLSARDSASLVSLLPPQSAGKALESLPPRNAAEIVAAMRPEDACRALRSVNHEQVAGVFRHLHPEFIRTLLPGMDRDFSARIAEVLAYPPESAGRLMQTDFISFRGDLKVGEVIDRLRRMALRRVPMSYCYVVGEGNRLLGVLNMRDLLLSDPGAAAESIMIRDVVKVPPFTDREELVNLFGKRHFISIPVVNEDGRLLGVVSTASIIESSEEEAAEDIQLLFGASAEERAFSPAALKIRKRLPWLHVNLATAFLAASVVSLFEDLISRIAVLAVFMPVVAGMGGNAGIQTLGVVLRGLATREVKPHHAARLLGTELLAALANGAAVGVTTALAAWAWKGNPLLGLVVGMAMIANFLMAGLTGALIPLTMKRLGFDPAHSSGIFLTTATDMVGFFAFLGFAWLFQSKLL